MTTQVTERAGELWTQGARWDAILAALRTEGYSKVDCIKATVTMLRLPLADAKRVVHESETWRDVRGADDTWHDALADELRAGSSRP